MFLPLGGWTEHDLAGETTGDVRHAKDLSQFGPGGGGALEFGWKWLNLYSLVGQVDITAVGTRAWEKYANKHGSNISASAFQLGIHLVNNFDFFCVSGFRMGARLGLGFMRVWGNEDNRDYNLSYEYSFLKPSFSIRFGVEGSYTVAENTDLTSIVDYGLAFPGTSRLSESVDQPYQGFTIMLGVRYWLPNT